MVVSKLRSEQCKNDSSGTSIDMSAFVCWVLEHVHKKANLFQARCVAAFKKWDTYSTTNLSAFS